MGRAHEAITATVRKKPRETVQDRATTNNKATHRPKDKARGRHKNGTA